MTNNNDRPFKARQRISLVVLSVLITVPVLAVDRQSDPELLVGQTLLEEQRRIADREAALQAEIAEIEAEMDELRQRASLFDGVPFRVLTAPVEWAKSFSLHYGPWMIVWVSLLFLMYTRLHQKEAWERKRRRLKTLYFIFLVVSLLCLATAAASAQTASPAERTLPETLDLIGRQQSFEPWEGLLTSLEDPSCQDVEIPDEVRAWISERFPEAYLVSPVPDNGPQRTATIASIYKAAGDQEQAFAALEPLMELRYNARDPNAVHGFRTAIIILSGSPDPTNAKRLARRVSHTYGPEELAWLAATIRGCCYDDALEYLEAAKQRARNATEVLAVAAALIDFARGDDAYTYVRSSMRLTLDLEAMHQFLTFARGRSLPDLEQEILGYVIENNRSTSRLVAVAASLKEGGYEPAARRALTKALEQAESMEAMAAVCTPAFEWRYYDLLESALRKIVDVYGFPAASMTMPDPMILPVSQEKPLDVQPSMAVVIAMLAEHRNDLDLAASYYTEALRLELGRSLNCQQFPQAVNFTNFFYPYRFFTAQNRSSLLGEIEQAGRIIENYHLSRLSEAGIEGLESRLTAARHAKWQSRKDLLFGQIRFVIMLFFLLYFFAFISGLACVFVYSQYIVVRRVRFHVCRLRHFRTLGGALRCLELEGFILLASVLFAPLALLLLVLAQGGLTLLYSELHQFRVAAEFHSRSPEKWPVNPMTYREAEGRFFQTDAPVDDTAKTTRIQRN